MIEQLNGGHRPEVSFSEWRRGDQRYYVSDTSAFRKATGWSPAIAARQGVRLLHEWLLESRRGLRRAAKGCVRSFRPSQTSLSTSVHEAGWSF